MSTLLIRNMKVAGTFFRTPAEQEALKALAGAERDGYLIAEPTNEVDPYAVKVVTDTGVHCGYVPAVWSGLCLEALGLRAGGQQPCKLVIQANKTLEVFVTMEGE